MTIAALYGTAVGFTDYYHSIIVETHDGRVMSVSKDTFDYLYHRLDNFSAALKEDCIEYVTNEFSNNEDDYPDWYREAEEHGQIYEECGVVVFYEENGEIAMSPGSVILRNFKGELRHMEFDDFSRYYDVKYPEEDE